MGLVLPWWLALLAIIAHRIHLKIFDGCALSKLQKASQGLDLGLDYLQQLTIRLFGKFLPKKYVKPLDRALVAASLIVIGLSAMGLSWFALLLVSVLFAAFGLKYSWKMLKTSSVVQGVCQIESTCGEVKNSKFSSIFGLPIEYLGVGYFGFLVIAQICLAINNFEPVFLQNLVFGLSVVGILGSAVFVFIQAKVIKSLCQSCMTIHGISFSVCILQGLHLLI